MKKIKSFLLNIFTKKEIQSSQYINISKTQIESWQKKKWEKDNVEKLITKNGFYLKQDGRNGTIYFVENNQLCEIYFESSGVKEFDILVFFEQLTHWELPNKKEMLEIEKLEIFEKLKNWLANKKLKSDL